MPGTVAWIEMPSGRGRSAAGVFTCRGDATVSAQGLTTSRKIAWMVYQKICFFGTPQEVLADMRTYKSLELFFGTPTVEVDEEDRQTTRAATQLEQWGTGRSEYFIHYGTEPPDYFPQVLNGLLPIMGVASSAAIGGAGVGMAYSSEVSVGTKVAEVGVSMLDAQIRAQQRTRILVKVTAGEDDGWSGSKRIRGHHDASSANHALDLDSVADKWKAKVVLPAMTAASSRTTSTYAARPSTRSRIVGGLLQDIGSLLGAGRSNAAPHGRPASSRPTNVRGRRF